MTIFWLGYQQVLYTDPNYEEALLYTCSAVHADGSCMSGHMALLILSRNPHAPPDGSILWIIVASNMTDCLNVTDIQPLLNDGKIIVTGKSTIYVVCSTATTPVDPMSHNHSLLLVKLSGIT